MNTIIYVLQNIVIDFQSGFSADYKRKVTFYPYLFYRRFVSATNTKSKYRKIKGSRIKNGLNQFGIFHVFGLNTEICGQVVDMYLARS